MNHLTEEDASPGIHVTCALDRKAHVTLLGFKSSVARCRTVGRLLNLSGPISLFKMYANNSTYFTRLVVRLLSGVCKMLANAQRIKLIINVDS